MSLWAKLSDHRPLICLLNLNLQCAFNLVTSGPMAESKRYAWRWDKSELNLFYNESYLELKNTAVPFDCMSCNLSCSNRIHKEHLNLFYNKIELALHNAAAKTIT